MTATRRGRPLRFMMILFVGWVMARAVLIAGWGVPAEAPIEEVRLPPLPVALALPPAKARTLPGRFHPRTIPDGHVRLRIVRLAKPAAHLSVPYRLPTREGIALGAVTAASIKAASVKSVMARDDPTGWAITPGLAGPPVRSPASQGARWMAGAWLFWRDGSSLPGTATQGRLGGSQVGARLDFDLTPQAPSRTTVYARASAALNRPAAPEAALGVAFQPDRAIPISLMAERRIALGTGGRNANALLVVGGFGPKAIGAVLEAEGYGQTGLVGFHSRDLFADGKISLLHSPAASRLRIGASLSGGAQPAVNRLDIGPEAQIRLPFPGANGRLVLEWRQRILGNAAPRSGLALTLAADF